MRTGCANHATAGASEEELTRASFGLELILWFRIRGLPIGMCVVMAVLYLYRIVICKTCGSRIDVEFLGPALNVRIAGTVIYPIQLLCVTCGESNRYTYSDQMLFAKDHPPNRMHKAG